MALQSQTVNVNLRGGVDTKTDQRLVIPSKLTVATDVELQDSNTIVTRPGLSERTLTLGGVYGAAVRMFEHSNVPVIEFFDGTTQRCPDAGTGFGAFGAAALSYEANTFARVGALTRRAQSITPKLNLPGAGVPLYDRNFDVAVGIVNYCIAWEEPGSTGRSAVRYSIRALANDAEIQFGVFTDAGGGDIYVKPRVIYDTTSGRFTIFTAHFLSGGATYDVEGSRIQEAGGAFTGPAVMISVPASGAVEGALGLEALFDVAIAQGSGYSVCARQTDAAGTIYMRLMTLGLTPFGATTNGAPAAKPVSLTAYAALNAGVFTGYAFYGAGANLRGYRLPVSTNVQSAEATITTIGGSLVGRVAVSADLPGTAINVVADVFTNTANSYADQFLVLCSLAQAFTSQTRITTNCFIAGRIFAMRSRQYIPVVFTSTQFQSVLLVLDITCAVRNLPAATAAQPLFVARVDWGDIANPSPLALDSAHRVPGCSELLVPYLKFETNTRLAGVTNTTSIDISFLKLASQEQLGDVHWNGDTYLAGALPMLTDGVRVVEEGFHWNPEVLGTVTNGLVVIPPLANGTGIIDIPAPASYPATYVLAFTESWQDAQGNWYESGISSYCSLTIAAVGNRAINPTIIRPPSLKRDQAQLVGGYKTGLTMYRTKASSADTTLYLAHSVELGTGLGAVTEADIGAGEPLYLEGGILGNTPAPSCRQMSLFDQRMVLSGCGDGSKVYWSKQQSQGFAAEFVSDDVAFQQIIPSKVGRVVATAEMSGKLVVTGEEEVGIIYGTGPNTSGVGVFNPYETGVKNVGALWTAPKSVKLSAEGVWFQSTFGLRLFTGAQIARHENGLFVGSEVDALVAGNCVTLAGGATQQTRFFFPETALVWDQTWGQFTQFTRHQGKDACLVSGVYFIVTGGTTILKYRDETVFYDYDAGNFDVVTGVIQLAPLQFGGLQGFERVYDMVVLGNAPVTGSAQFAIDVGYDGKVPAVELPLFIATISAAGVVQFQHQFFTQKCSSLLLKVSFQEGNGLGRIRLTDIAFSVGVKRGPWKSAEMK